MRFSDFQVGIGVSLRKKSRGALEIFLSFSWLGSVSQLLLQEGTVYHPCTTLYLPLDSVFVERTKKLPKLVFSGLYNWFFVCTLSARIISIVKLFVVDGPYMITTIIYLL